LLHLRPAQQICHVHVRGSESIKFQSVFAHVGRQPSIERYAAVTARMQ